jgi:hypothetical protein
VHLSTRQGPAATTSTPSRGVIACKSHPIIKLPKHVHQTPLNPKQMLKDVMQFDKLGLERVLGHPIELTSLKFGVFPRWSLV